MTIPFFYHEVYMKYMFGNVQSVIVMHEMQTQICQVNHYSPVQIGAEYGLLGGPLNCIGYWTTTISIIIIKPAFYCLHWLPVQLRVDYKVIE